jgi:hypothetical protein
MRAGERGWSFVIGVGRLVFWAGILGGDDNR